TVLETVYCCLLILGPALDQAQLIGADPLRSSNQMERSVPCSYIAFAIS
ncbi:hypothetical protein LINPERHAP2_LOCUS21609, partial [Linum perenne]